MQYLNGCLLRVTGSHPHNSLCQESWQNPLGFKNLVAMDPFVATFSWQRSHIEKDKNMNKNIQRR